MKKYQKAIDEWVQGYEEPYWPALSILARIVEEVGEMARLLNHIYGSKPKKVHEAEQELGQEIADVMFSLICLANKHGIDLDKEMEKVIQKSHDRDKDRFQKK